MDRQLDILELGAREVGLGKALSNFIAYPFVLDGVHCGSIEGILQSFKWADPEKQAEVANMTGYAVFKLGQTANSWKTNQTLYWRGYAYPRLSKDYHDLLLRAYDACFDQNVEFATALYETGDALYIHTIGKHDPTDTTLTEWEYIYNMYRLRARVQQIMRGNDVRSAEN